MRRINLLVVTIILLALFSAEIALAKETHQPAVRTLAINFLERRNKIRVTASQQRSPLILTSINEFRHPAENHIMAYIAHVAPKGFIILSAETDIEPVIAYSFRYNWDPDTGSANILYSMLIADSRLRKTALANRPAEYITAMNRKRQQQLNNNYVLSELQNFRQWPAEGTTKTSGWLETTWHQFSPYNDFCPVDPVTNQRSVVGCVATAMAQIVNYHKSVGLLSFKPTDSYTTGDIRIDADSSRLDFPSFKMMNDYLEKIQYNYRNNLPLDSLDATALNFACGLSLDMSYSSESSITYTRLAAFALTKKFRCFNALYLPSAEKHYHIFKKNI